MLGTSHPGETNIFSIEYFNASLPDNLIDHKTRCVVEAPNPVLLYSAYNVVFSLSGFDQLFQPSGAMNEPISQFRKAVLA